MASVITVPRASPAVLLASSSPSRAMARAVPSWLSISLGQSLNVVTSSHYAEDGNALGSSVVTSALTLSAPLNLLQHAAAGGSQFEKKRYE